MIEMVDNDRESPIIDRALEAAVKKAGGARIMLLNRDGDIVRDTGGIV